MRSTRRSSGDDDDRVTTAIVALCRAGFEVEAARDLGAIAKRAAATLECIPSARSGYVVARLADFEMRRWQRASCERPPVFVRTSFIGTGPHVLIAATARGRADRITPLVDAVTMLRPPPLKSVWVEFPDTNEGKALSTLARALEPRLLSRLAERGLVDATQAMRLHIFLVDGTAAYVGTSDDATASPWPMGIPRLRMPHGAPSRSTLKLAEAFVTFLGEREATLLRPGLRAVDLGAAPGGWTWQLLHRGLRVTAVDNGALKGDVARDPLVTHVRDDGLKWRPRRPVDWLVCDIVEQPRLIATLISSWIGDGATRRAIFNLKLPMKKRYDEVEGAREAMSETLTRAGLRFELRFRQLYHDREEVTGYAARSD
jgi:23S rRNA (cytidine2498-2'-O)-methyltransferase